MHAFTLPRRGRERGHNKPPGQAHPHGPTGATERGGAARPIPTPPPAPENVTAASGGTGRRHEEGTPHPSPRRRKPPPAADVRRRQGEGQENGQRHPPAAPTPQEGRQQPKRPAPDPQRDTHPQGEADRTRQRGDFWESRGEAGRMRNHTTTEQRREGRNDKKNS